MNKNLRNIFYRLHLWPGIISGIVLFIVCLTGAIYVIKPEIERFLEPEKFYCVPPGSGAEKIPIDTLIETVEKRENGKIVYLEVEDDPKRTWMLLLFPNQAETRNDHLYARLLYVDPYTSEITGQGHGKAFHFFATVLRIHRSLGLPAKFGRALVGISTLVFVLTLFSGVFLWLPRNFRNVKSWKSGLLIRFRKGKKRLLFDLHNTLGFYTMIPMLLLALTGLCWSFSWYKDAVSRVLYDPVFAVAPRAKISTAVDRNTKPLPLSEILAIHEQYQPGRGNMSIRFPAPGTRQSLVIQKGGYGLFAFSVQSRYEYDPFTCEVLSCDRFQDKSTGAKISSMICAIHLGEIFGAGSRIIFFIVSIIATSLPITGAWLWINKLRKKYSKKFSEHDA